MEYLTIKQIGTEWLVRKHSDNGAVAETTKYQTMIHAMNAARRIGKELKIPINPNSTGE